MRPPPIRDLFGSKAWMDWFRDLRDYISELASGVAVDHATLGNLNSPMYSHLTATQANDLTDGGTTGLHTHDHGALGGLTDDDHAQYLRTDGTRDSTGEQVFTAGIVLPNTGTTGQKVNPDSPAFGWRDLEGAINWRDTGIGSPTLSTFRGNIRGPSFSAGDDYDLTYHIPHDYVPGTDLHIHIHWAHNGTNISGSMVVTYYMSYAKGHNQAVFPAESTLVHTIAGLNITNCAQYLHRIDEIQCSTAGGSASQMNTTDIEVDGLIEIHFDVTSIPTITGGVARPFIKYVDIHYQSNNLPTLNKSPNFYA